MRDDTDDRGDRPRAPALRHLGHAGCGCPTSSATAVSTCASAPTATAASTCWPRPTARSGRSSTPGVQPVDKEVEPSLADDMVARTTSSTPSRANDSYEEDQGRQPHADPARQRWGDGCGSTTAPTPAPTTRCRCTAPRSRPPDDGWKAGVYEGDADGVASLSRFNNAEATTVMGWFKMTGQNPTPRLQRHRAGRRARRQLRRARRTRAARADQRQRGAAARRAGPAARHRRVVDVRRVAGLAATCCPQDEWVHLAATFDFANGSMALYRNGQPVDGFYTRPTTRGRSTGRAPRRQPAGHQDRRLVPAERHRAQPCNCRMDGLMFLDTVASADEVAQQYRRFLR